MCVDSVLAQTFTDFECILVNDGSQDNCSAICDDYAKKDSRVKVIHKENGGVSSARNAGLDIAQSEWIIFVDSDDWVDKNYLEFLYDNAIKNSVDVSICGINSFENGVVRYFGKRVRDTLLAPQEAILLKFDNKSPIGGYSFNKLFKRLLVEKSGLRFDKSVAYMEDTLFFYNIFKIAEKIYFSQKPFYFYRKIEFSVSNRAGFTYTVNSAICTLEKIYENEMNPKIRQKIYARKIGFIARKCFAVILKSKNDKELESNMHILKRCIFAKNALPLKLRCKVFALLYFSWMIPFYLRIKNMAKPSYNKGNNYV